jgi:hypothetical protein
MNASPGIALASTQAFTNNNFMDFSGNNAK